MKIAMLNQGAGARSCLCYPEHHSRGNSWPGAERTGAPRILVRAPRESLRPFVERFLIVEFPAAQTNSHLPETGMFARFQLHGSCLLNGNGKAPPAGLTGLWDRTRVYQQGRDSAVLLVAFTATGAASFLQHPADQFSNATVALDGILDHPSDLVRVRQQLDEARNPTTRFQLIENFLLARLANCRPDLQVSAAVSKIKEAHGLVRIEDLAFRVGLSQSALERRFRQVVGAPPKQFASTVRLHRVLDLRERGGDFTSIAYAAGYYDQSHFIKDFKQMTGLAPESFFQGRNRG